MMYKESTFSSYTPEGHPLIQILNPLGSSFSMEKTAGIHPEVLKFKQMLEPEPNKTYVHILALGAGDYYGANLNNDYFPWAGLSYDHTTTPHKFPHGYKTFLNAHSFAHHVNKDPAKSYGDVILSTLNHKMKRVELVVAIDHERCERNGGSKVLQKIHEGKYPSTSMGCRVPFDTCSICGNKAKTRAQYCEHMKLMPGKILPDGRKVFVYNDHPRFFDISFVFIGADRTSFVLEKIANRHGIFVPSEYGALEKVAGAKLGKSLRSATGVSQKNTKMRVRRKIRQNKLTIKPITFGKLNTALKKGKKARGSNLAMYSTNQSSQYTLKSGPLISIRGGGTSPVTLSKESEFKEAEHAKLSEIFKRVNSLPMGKAVPMRVGRESDIPPELLDGLAQRGDFGSTLGDLGSAGIVLKPREFQRMSLVHAGRRELADQFHSRGHVFNTGHSSPLKLRSIQIKISPRPSSSLMDDIRPIMEERSSLGPIGIRRIRILAMRKPSVPFSETNHPVLNKLASLYDEYRQDLLLNLEDMTKSAMHSPEILRSIASVRGGPLSLGEDEMHALYMLPLVYFSQAYWDGTSRGCTSDQEFVKIFTRKNPTIAKYLANKVASGQLSSIIGL
jgi:hypothetical protein